MNPYFLMSLAVAALVVWTAGSFFFWRISQANKARSARKDSQPAFRLAEQWLSESQRKLEELYKRSEQPLGTAQNELLELRLEAARLPQGAKGLRSVRESLAGDYKPLEAGKTPLDLVRLYLTEGDYRQGSGGLLFLKTPLGEMPCLEAGEKGNPLGDADMKKALSLLSAALNQNPATGGFLYLGDDRRYQACLQKPDWMEGLKSQRLMAVDFRGLTALLLSLRMSRDSEKVCGAFEQGVEATRLLLGQSEKMSAELSRLSSHSLKIRSIMEGGVPSDLAEKE